MQECKAALLVLKEDSLLLFLLLMALVLAVMWLAQPALQRTTLNASCANLALLWLTGMSAGGTAE
jgi:hypothetical protein